MALPSAEPHEAGRLLLHTAWLRSAVAAPRHAAAHAPRVRRRQAALWCVRPPRCREHSDCSGWSDRVVLARCTAGVTGVLTTPCCLIPPPQTGPSTRPVSPHPPQREPSQTPAPAPPLAAKEPSAASSARTPSPRAPSPPPPAAQGEARHRAQRCMHDDAQPHNPCASSPRPASPPRLLCFSTQPQQRSRPCVCQHAAALA